MAVPAPVGTPGTVVASAASVVTPTTLTPGTGSGYAIGDTLFCFTCCSSATPTVATPSGWTSVLNITGTNGRIALFAKVAASTSDAAPSVVWSSLTTGTSGTPCMAWCFAIVNLNDATLSTMADVVGTISNGAASTTTSAGGTGITTTTVSALVLSLSTRLDDVGTWSAPAGFTMGGSNLTTSGNDMSSAWAYQVKATPGAVTAPNFGLSGASSFASSGVMIAFKAVAVSFPRTAADTVSVSDAVSRGWGVGKTAADSWTVSDGGGIGGPTDYVLAYDFEEGTGLTVHDLTSNHRDGTLQSANWMAGKVGTYALDLMGFATPNDGVVIPAAVGLGTVLSACSWIKFNDATDGIAFCGSGTGDYFLYYDTTDFYFSAGGAFVSQAHGLTLPDAAWRHYAVARNGTSVQFYLDGVPLGSVKTLSANNASGFQKIGAYMAGTFPALISVDDFRIYTRTLSSTEILAIKTGGGSGTAIVRVAAHPRPAADSWSISDAAVGVPSGGGGGTSYPRTATDTVTLSDAAVRSAAHPRTASDSWTISDGGSAGAFPANTTLIDDFNRVNNNVNVGAGSAIWADWPLNGATSLLQIVSNTLTGNAGNQALTWPGLPYGPDIDVQFKVSTKGSGYLAFFFAFQPGGTGNYPSSVFSGYALTLDLAGTSIWDLRSYTGGSGSIISGSAVTQSWATGDLIGVSMRGSTLSAYRKPSGGSWTLITQVTDTSHNQAGSVGWETGGGASHFLDDLIGGTVSGGAVGRLVSLVRPAADTVVLSDAAVRAPAARPRTAADTVALSDVATGVATGGTANLTRTASDTVALSDAATRIVALPRATSDLLTVSDSAVRAAATRTRTATDSLTVSDTAVKGGIAQRTAADSWTLSDIAVRAAGAQLRVAADTVVITDAVARAASKSRIIADSLTVSDVAGRASARARTAADSVSLSDTVIVVSVPRLALTSTAHATGTLFFGFVERILRPDGDLAISGWTGTFADVNDQSDLTVVTAVIA